MDTDHWITAVLALRKARRVVVFTGAGVSVESGIPTFRDAGGFWERFPPDQFATWSGLIRALLLNRRLAAEFVWNVVEPIAKAEPNAAHEAIARLEQSVPVTVITQNIDGLHQMAGSTSVQEVHGSLLELVDTSTGAIVHRVRRSDLFLISQSLRGYLDRRISTIRLISELRRYYPIDWRGRNRPNLILFGDSLAEPAWTNSLQAANECDVFLSIGTSGAVYPAALLPLRAASVGATVINIGPQTEEGCWLQGTASTVMPKLVSTAFPSN